jgi:dolichol-phosphate mannosyltransferase
VARAFTNFSLVIPTRNEAANVDALVAAICAAMPGSSKELVFVDDSDDATPALLQRILAQTDCPGLVVQRANGNREGGLSTAVVRGISASSGTYICTMDADLQHPASAIPLLFDTAREQQADIVVGSRYAPGGSGAQGFDGLRRYAVSQAARLAAQRFLPASRWTTDPLSGFFVIRRSVVSGVELRPIGYKILLEILVRGRWKRIADVAYAFHSRNAGVSKATLREGLQFARHVTELRKAPAVRRTRPDAKAPALSASITIPPVFARAQASPARTREIVLPGPSAKAAKGQLVEGKSVASGSTVEQMNA